MPVAYYFDKLHVSNFRGIRDLELGLAVGHPLHLIGSNNAGKSTLLHAVAFALRGGGFHQYDLTIFDFFKPSRGNHAREFRISLTLKADKEMLLPAVQGVGQYFFVHAVRAKGTLASSGRMEKHFNLLDSDGDPIAFSTRTPLKPADKAELAGQTGVGWSPTSARHDHIREHLPEVMLLAPHNVHQSLFQWKTGPLNRLAAMLAKRFLEDKWQFAYGAKTTKMPDGILKAHNFLSTAVGEFPFWKDDLRVRLSDTLSRYVGRHTRIELQPMIQEIEDWLKQQLLLSFSADEHGTTTPIECMGDGLQSLIRLAALDVLSQYPDQVRNSVVLLFEEPETHLHPHLQRRMRSVLDRLAAGGWCVVTTTHSPELINFESKQRVSKVRREGDNAAIAQVETLAIPDAIKIQGKIDEHGNRELFFAKKVILCEGRDDEFAIKTGLKTRHVDVDGRSISVLGIGGKGNIIDYITLLRAIGTPWCTLLDEDRLADGSYKNDADKIAAKIDSVATTLDKRLQWTVDLEHCFGIGRNASKPGNPEHKAYPEWQHSALAHLHGDEIAAKYPVLTTVLDAAAKWTEA